MSPIVARVSRYLRRQIIGNLDGDANERRQTQRVVRSKPTSVLCRESLRVIEQRHTADSEQGSARVGETFGRYQLLGLLGQGGMGRLYIAERRGIQGFVKIVALKRILPHLADSKQLREMFLNEARIAARLEHPNIVATYELGEVDGNYFISMEYLPGEDLSAISRAARTSGACRSTIAAALAQQARARPALRARGARRPGTADRPGPPRRQPAQHLRHLSRRGEAARLRRRQRPEQAEEHPRRVQGKVRLLRAGAARGRPDRSPHRRLLSGHRAVGMPHRRAPVRRQRATREHRRRPLAPDRAAERAAPGCSAARWTRSRCARSPAIRTSAFQRARHVRGPRSVPARARDVPPARAWVAGWRRSSGRSGRR